MYYSYQKNSSLRRLTYISFIVYCISVIVYYFMTVGMSLNYLLVLIHNSLSKNKESHNHEEVWISHLIQHKFWWFYFSVYSLFFFAIEKIHQTLKTVFHWLSKHLKFHQKYSAVHCAWSSLVSVWISQRTLSLVFDIFHTA